MAAKPGPDIDDELFNEVYGKAYTGPPGSSANGPEQSKSSKKPLTNEQSDDEDGPRDPNAVPTDFTSREAKVWEAKAKATERNWKKRKEEELICKICGESGHFTQGCPSTLGANRKSSEFFERVAARDRHVRSLFSGKVISRIERDTGCKIKMDEKFLIVSGKDRLILVKGVDAVHKIIQEGNKDEMKSHTSPSRSKSSHASPPRNRSSPLRNRSSPPRNRSSPPRNRSNPPRNRSSPPRNRSSPPRNRSSHTSPPRNRSRSPEGRLGASHYRRSESQRSHSSPRNAPLYSQRGFAHERTMDEQMKEDLKRLRGSPQAYGHDGARQQKSPPNATYAGDVYASYDGSHRNGVNNKADSWNVARRALELHPVNNTEFSSFPQTLEELETEIKKEAMECGRIRDQEEDEENYKHRECIRELRENYMKKLAIMRGMHAKQWEEFLQFEMQRRQQARYNTFNQPNYADYERRSGNVSYAAASGLSLEPMSRYQYPGEEFAPPRGHEPYGQLQRQRLDDFGKAYGRY